MIRSRSLWWHSVLFACAASFPLPAAPQPDCVVVISLNYLQGDSVQTLIKWDDAAKTLSLEPASKQTASRTFKIEIIPDGVTKKIRYTGERLELKF